MNDDDREHEFESDPFFEFVPDSEWNATLGSQGYEENYLDGYIEAAIELADAVVQKRLYGQRDTLILPILYNARHAVELNVKYVYYKLVEAGVVRGEERARDHNISAYWQHLIESNIRDSEFRNIIRNLGIFVRGLEKIDLDGQGLRYHCNRDGEKSLRNFSIANLKLVRESLGNLQKILSKMQYRAVDLVNERKIGTFTKACSRLDLMMIAGRLPPRNQWKDLAFRKIKEEIQEEFRLTSNELSKAFHKIQETRELGALIGVENPLLYLEDDDVIFIIDQWRRLHPKFDDNKLSIKIFNRDAVHFKNLRDRANLYQDLINIIDLRLDFRKICDLDVVFYRERDGVYSEYYEEEVEKAVSKNSPQSGSDNIRQLLEKTNLLENVRRSVARLGRISLAKSLQNM